MNIPIALMGILVLLSACGTTQPEALGAPGSGTFLTFEVDAAETYEPGTSMRTYEVVTRQKSDLYGRWQKHNELRIQQDKWDAWSDNGDDEDDGDFFDEDDDGRTERKSVRNSPLKLSCRHLACD